MTSLPNNNSGSVMISPQHDSVNGIHNPASLGISPITSPSLNSNAGGGSGAQPQSPAYYSPNGSMSPNSYNGNGGSPNGNSNNNNYQENNSSEDLKSISSDDKKKKLIVTPKLVAPANKKTISNGNNNNIANNNSNNVNGTTSSSSDEPPISKTLEGRMKSIPYIKKFKLPTTEILLHDYSAALFRQILLHGRLYLFTNHICFESKIFGIKTSETISIKDVVQIKKKVVGIEIMTNNNVKYSFASFVSRDKTYKELIEVWKDVTGETHEDVSSSLSIDDDIDDEISNSDQFMDNNNNNNNNYNENVNNNNVQQSNNNNNMNDSELQSAVATTTVREETSPNNNNSNNNIYINNNNNSVHNPQTINTEQVQQLQQEGGGSSSDDSSTTVIPVIGSVVATTTTTSSILSTTSINSTITSSSATATAVSSSSPATSLTPIKEVEKTVSPLDEIYGSVDQYLSKKDQQPQSILESQHSDFQEILSDNFNVSVVNFYRALYSDKCNFVHNYHVKRGDMNVNVKPWTFRDRFGTIRELEYVAPVSSPIGPDKTRIQETQRYHLTKTKLIVETDTIMLDIPYGDHFRIEAKWEINETSADNCRLTIALCVRFIKKTWFKSKIETTTIKETKTSFDKWVQLAKLEIQKMLQVKPTITITPGTPTKQNGLIPTIIIPSLNKSMDRTELNRLRNEDGERLDSPKPHHTRSRSRQHLISSSNQVNSSSPSSNSVLSSMANSQNNNNSPMVTPNSSLTPNSPFNVNNINNGVDNNNNINNPPNFEPNTASKYDKKSDKLSLNNDDGSCVTLKTPVGVLSFSSGQLSILAICSLLFILYSYMFMKILTLSSKIDTMESIFKDLINKNLNDK